MSAPTPAVYAAISKVQRALAGVGIGKDRRNTQQGYSYRGIDDVYNALAPLLADAGLCIIPRCTERIQTERESARGGVLFSVVVRAEFDFVAAADGSTHTAAVWGEAMDSADKATNKAMSAAMKYACMMVFCIPTEGDNDADATTHQISAPPPPPSAPKKPALDADLAAHVAYIHECLGGEAEASALASFHELADRAVKAAMWAHLSSEAKAALNASNPNPKA